MGSFRPVISTNKIFEVAKKKILPYKEIVRKPNFLSKENLFEISPTCTERADNGEVSCESYTLQGTNDVEIGVAHLKHETFQKEIRN